MCLNASLAGLVGITAGCDALDGIGAAVVGIVSGILVVVVVELLDLKLHIDDPVGAVGVHMANGIWGTIAVGLLANPDAPAGLRGLFYTGDFHQTGLQLLGFVTVAAYAAIMIDHSPSPSSRSATASVSPRKKNWPVWTAPNTACPAPIPTSSRQWISTLPSPFPNLLLLSLAIRPKQKLSPSRRFPPSPKVCLR